MRIATIQTPFGPAGGRATAGEYFVDLHGSVRACPPTSGSCWKSSRPERAAAIDPSCKRRMRSVTRRPRSSFTPR